MRRFVISGLSLLALSTEASAQRWEASRHGPSVAAGIVAIRTVSDEVNSTVSALACRAGRASLVIAQFGGDYRAGPTNLRIGDQTFTVVFANDPAMARALGGGDVVASSAPLTRDALVSLRTARSIRFPDVQQPLPLTGLAQRWSAIEQACAATLASAAGAPSGQPSTQAAQPPATGRGAPYGVWVFPDGLTGQCVDGGPGFAIERDSILISDGGETQTWNNVSFVSCSGDVCTFQQRGSNLRWSTRWLSADRIILNGPQLDRRAARVEGIRENVAARCSMVR